MEETNMHLASRSGKEVIDEQTTEKKIEKLKIKAPEPKMHFDTFDDLYEYYRQYGKQEGFGIKKKTTCASLEGKLKFFSLSCSRAGKSQSCKQNYLLPNPLTRTECKARVNGTVLEDGKCKINSVTLEHNHGLSPQKSRFYLCNKEIGIGVQRKLELNDRVGISVTKNFQSFVVEAGGHDNVPFSEKDCRNYIEKARRLRLGVGDAEAIREYFIRMQSKNSNFFYMMDLDDKARIKNLFWADARSRAIYEEFGDVVMFDTTYLTNKYDMPFAPFVGVNHHGHSVLFGCGLVSAENTETFVWLFKTWLACMSGRAPNAIITDQDKAMKKEIEVVFPQTRHRWCLWHIMKKIPEKLSGYETYKQIKKALKICVYNSFTIEEFQESWELLVEDFNLQGNAWLNSLYEERHRWVPAFVKDTFWAGMSTTQRSESMNSFFDAYVNSKTTLKQFVEQYDSALRDKIEKEINADFKSFSTWVPCVTHFQIERQFQAAYTNAKFKEFQKEVTGKLYCDVSCVDENVGIFDVCEVVFFKEGNKEVHFNVQFDKQNSEVKCACRLFESKGILCKHTISVLIRMGVKNVPTKYVLSRWRKNLRRCHTKIKVPYDDFSKNPEAQRYQELQKKFDKVADWACMSNEKYQMLLIWMDEFETKVNKEYADYEMDQSNACISPTKETSESNRLLAPVVVRRYGRPPKNRKISKMEQASMKNKGKGERAKKGKEVKEQKMQIPSLLKEQVTSFQPVHIPYFQYPTPSHFSPLVLPSTAYNTQELPASSQTTQYHVPYTYVHYDHTTNFK